MSCLHLVYNLFSPDLLQRVRDKRQASCTDKDGAAFQLPAGWSVLNEIGKAFSIARAQTLIPFTYGYKITSRERQ